MKITRDLQWKEPLPTSALEVVQTEQQLPVEREEQMLLCCSSEPKRIPAGAAQGRKPHKEIRMKSGVD